MKQRKRRWKNLSIEQRSYVLLVLTFLVSTTMLTYAIFSVVSTSKSRARETANITRVVREEMSQHRCVSHYAFAELANRVGIPDFEDHIPEAYVPSPCPLPIQVEK